MMSDDPDLILDDDPLSPVEIGGRPGGRNPGGGNADPQLGRPNKVEAAEDPDSGPAQGCTAASSGGAGVVEAVELRSRIEGKSEVSIDPAGSCGVGRGL